MVSASKSTIASHMALMAIFHSSLTSIMSVVYIIVCILGLVYRSMCDYVDLQNERGSEFFGNVFYRVYILDSSCNNSVTPVEPEVTSSHTVFIFLVLTLVTSICTLMASITLTLVIHQENNVQKYLNPCVITYIGLCLVSLVTDLVIGVFFGIDYENLSNKLNMSSGGLSINYFMDSLRLGATLLMSVALKGYVYHAINIVMIIVLCFQLAEYNKLNEHSIHKVGALKAYEPQRQPNSWHPQPEIFLGLSRGQQLNPAFIHDEDYPVSPSVKSTTRDIHESAQSDYSNRFFDRSESWQGRSAHSGSRPFSYLGDASRPVVTPATRTPPIPAPDYSPLAGKRLKSVLKPAYM